MSEQAEQWWINHATLLADKMKLGGVQSFHIELTDRGTFKFEVNPLSPQTTNQEER